MARTLTHGMDETSDWQSAFREPYVVVLREAAAARSPPRDRS